MNLKELRDAVYDYLLAEEDRGLWTSQEIDRYIHTAHLRLFGTVAEAMQDFCVVTSTISEVADQADYNLPTDFFRLVWLRRLLTTDGSTLTPPIPLNRISRDAHDIYRRIGTETSPNTTPRTAEYFYLNGAKTITLLQTPSASQTASLQIRYIFRPAQMTQDSHVPFQQTAGSGGAGYDNLEEYHDLIWTYAARLAAMKEESMDQVMALERLYQMRLDELKEHIDNTNIHEPRFVRGSGDTEYEDF